MNGLTDTQQFYVTLIAEVLQSVSLATIPSTLLGQLPSYVPFLLFLCGAISKSIMQKLGGALPQQGLMDELQTAGPMLIKFSQMTPPQQAGILALLEMSEQPPPVSK